MKMNSTHNKKPILATKKRALSEKKAEPLVFVPVSKDEIAATRNPAYKYLIK